MERLAASPLRGAASAPRDAVPARRARAALLFAALAVGALACSDLDRTRIKALLGSANAQVRLAYYYGTGRGGAALDDEEAVKWYRRAAEQSHPVAQRVLGLRSQVGQGVAEDRARAWMWLTLAAESGDAEAEAARAAMRDELTAAELSEGERLLREWRAEH